MTDLFGDKLLTNRGDRLNPDSTWDQTARGTTGRVDVDVTWNHSPSGRTRDGILIDLFVDSSENVLLVNLPGTFED